MQKRFASDVMTRKIVTVRTDTPVTELARLLSEHRVTGVPVLDAHGRLAGVVSASDIVANELKVGREVISESAWYARPDLAARGELTGPGMHLEDYGDALVRDIMTPVVLSAPATASIEELARIMGTNRVHRVLIVEGDTLVGIVSALDLLSSLPSATIDGRRPEVLWATDLRTDPEHVGRVAIGLAHEIGARLTVLHVTPSLPTLLRVYGERPELTALQLSFEEMALGRLVDLSRKLLGHVPGHELIARSGDPAETILRAIAERRPAYVVLGAERPASERLAGLGSVAARILVASPVPVVTVPADDCVQ